MQGNIFFTDRQISILNGSLLGDGHLTKRSNSIFTKPQAIRRREYLDWHFEELLPFSKRVKDYPNRCNGKVYFRSVFATIASPLFTELRSKWYPAGVKKVPRDLRLDALALAVWFCDDGSNSVEDRSCKLATYSFSREDCEFLVEGLKMLGIEAYVDCSSVIRTRTSSYKHFVDMVAPYMSWACFAYKLKYRDSELKFTTDEEARRMIEMQVQGKTLTVIAAEMDCSVSVVSAMVRGERKKYLGQTRKELALNNKSGYKGICFDQSRNKWLVSIQVSGKTKNMGRFATLEEAVAAKESII